MIEPYFKILPFYDSVSKQRHRREYRMDDRYSVDDWIAPQNLLLPFQILRNNRINAVTEFALYGVDDVLEYNLLTVAVSGQLRLKTVYKDGTPFNVIMYLAQKDLTIDISCGQYYYKVSDGVQTWYSEIFTVKAFDGIKDNKEVISGDDIIGVGILKPEPIDILTSKK